MAKKVLLSVCCDAEVVVRGKTTHYYTCAKCGQPCDATMEKVKAINAPPRDKMIRRASVK